MRSRCFKMISYDAKEKVWRARVAVFPCRPCLDGQLHSCITVRKDNMFYSFGGRNSPNALPSIKFSKEHRDSVTISDEDGPEGSSQEDGGSTEYQFKLHLSAREQEKARNSILYNWIEPEIA